MLVERLHSPDIRGGPLAASRYRSRRNVRNRAFWESAGTARQYWIDRGERYRHASWPPLTPEFYATFERTGERAPFESAYHRRRQALTTLVLAEGFEHGGRFLPSLVDLVIRICDETTWVLPAHAGQAIDMFSAETANLLAWVLDIFDGQRAVDESPAPALARAAIASRVLDPYLMRDDCWWMASGTQPVGNWTTWCTSNCLGAALLLEDDASRRWRALEKSCTLLDRFLAAHAEDGGCDEGPTYWNFAAGCLFDALELLHDASGGAFDLFAEPVVANIGEYITKVHVDDLYFVNFADSLPQVPVDAALLFRFGRRLRNDRMQRLGAQLSRVLDRFDPEDTLRLKVSRALAALPDLEALRTLEAPADAPRESYLPKLQVMVARERPRAGDGLLVAAKGGHNGEGHNHNDVGNVVLYLDGRPVIIDVGMKEYSKDSFGDRRYDIWSMQSAFHNVPIVNGCQQRDGAAFAAGRARFTADADSAALELDIAGAYPPEASLVAWRRTCVLDRRARRVTIRDAFECRGDDNRIELRFLTCRVPARTNGCVLLPDMVGRCLGLTIDPQPTRVTLHELTLLDRQLRMLWGERVYQVRFVFDRVPRQGVCATRCEADTGLVADVNDTLLREALP